MQSIYLVGNDVPWQEVPLVQVPEPLHLVAAAALVVSANKQLNFHFLFPISLFKYTLIPVRTIFETVASLTFAKAPALRQAGALSLLGAVVRALRKKNTHTCINSHICFFKIVAILTFAGPTAFDNTSTPSDARVEAESSSPDGEGRYKIWRGIIAKNRRIQGLLFGRWGNQDETILVKKSTCPEKNGGIIWKNMFKIGTISKRTT